MGSTLPHMPHGARDNPVVVAERMAGVDGIEVRVAHNERATLRVGDVFLKVDADQRRTDVEVEAMALAPIPTPTALWRKPPVLASKLWHRNSGGECEWLMANGVLPADVVTHNRRLAETALRPWTPVFVHGDLQVDHIFVDGDEVTGVIDWSEGAPGDALFDLATLTLGHPEHHDDVVAGYGAEVAVLRSLL